MYIQIFGHLIGNAVVGEAHDIQQMFHQHPELNKIINVSAYPSSDPKRADLVITRHAAVDPGEARNAFMRVINALNDRYPNQEEFYYLIKDMEYDYPDGSPLNQEISVAEIMAELSKIENQNVPFMIHIHDLACRDATIKSFSYEIAKDDDGVETGFIIDF